jgi:hypothetical protein
MTNKVMSERDLRQLLREQRDMFVQFQATIDEQQRALVLTNNRVGNLMGMVAGLAIRMGQNTEALNRLGTAIGAIEEDAPEHESEPEAPNP